MRHCDDWINTFCRYIEDTETPPLFAKWTAISGIAAALRRKTMLEMGRLRIYPNLYVIFVGPPAKVVKTTSINYLSEIINDVDCIHLSSDSVTRERLFDDLASSRDQFVMPDGSTLECCNLTAIAKEFEIFIGQKKDNSKFLIALTDLFDGKNVGSWKHGTKHSGSACIPLPYLNMLGATTPTSLSRGLSTDSIGDGFTTRIIFVYQDMRHKDVPRPPWTPAHVAMKSDLVHDLNEIAQIAGTYTMSEATCKEYDTWFMHQRYSAKICLEDAFLGWYERKPLFVSKLAMIVKASQGDDKVLVWEDFQRAIAVLEEAEYLMALAFRGVGRNEFTPDMDQIISIVRSRKIISDQQLQLLTLKDISEENLRKIIPTLVKVGYISNLTRDPETGKPGLYYVWKGAKQ